MISQTFHCATIKVAVEVFIQVSDIRLVSDITHLHKVIKLPLP